MIYCCCYVSVAHLIMDSYHHVKFPCAVWESEIRLGFKIILGLAIVIKNYNRSSYLSSAREESSDVKVCFSKKRLKSAALLVGELLRCFAVIGSLIPCFTLIGSQVARPIATTVGDYQKAARAAVYISEIPSGFCLPQLLWIPAVMYPFLFVWLAV